MMKSAEKLRRAIDKEDVAEVKAVIQNEGRSAKDTCLYELPTGGNSLHYAAAKGLCDIIQVILDTGVDVNCRRQDGDAVKGATALHEAANELHTDAVNLLLAKGADVRSKDDNGVTAIHIACRENAIDLVQTLLEAGADVNALDNRGNSPLLVTIMRSAYECALFIMENGAEVKMTDREGSSPLHYAAEWESLALVEAMVARGADVNLQDNDGNTPLHVTGDDEVFELLVKHGADASIRNKRGRAARDQRLDMEREDFAKINAALANHANKEETHARPSHSARLQNQHAPVSRIFSPGPPLPETELRTARTNMLKELQKRSGYEGPAPLTIPGQSKVTPRTPRSTGPPQLVSPLARDAPTIHDINNHFSKTTISTAK